MNKLKELDRLIDEANQVAKKKGVSAYLFGTSTHGLVKVFAKNKSQAWKCVEKFLKEKK